MRWLILYCLVTMKAGEVEIMITIQCFLSQVKQVIMVNVLLTVGAEKAGFSL